jgi:D-tyrosyl-tRNA(Tyr) deacylase
MRLIVQRVAKASVKVEGKLVGEIGKGLFVLVGVKKEDTQKDAAALAEKLYKLRVMADAEGKMNLSVAEAQGEFLVVSQFTLYADTSGGNRPSFIQAAQPDIAKALYEYFLARLKEKGAKVQTGSFGEYMQIESIGDGPVTILLES